MGFLYLRKKNWMRKSSIVIIIYIFGLIIGALFFDIWEAQKGPKQALLGAGWTALFLISLFFSEKKEWPVEINEKKIYF